MTETRRTALIQARVHPEAAQHFRDIATARGITTSQAIREALAQWVQRNRALLTPDPAVPKRP